MWKTTGLLSALFSAVISLCGIASSTQILAGIDGSAASLTWQSTPFPDGSSVTVCAQNAASHQVVRGFSLGSGAPVVVPPGQSHCRRVAPARHTFVLWTYGQSPTPVRSVSTSMDLTQRIDQMLTFYWIE